MGRSLEVLNGRAAPIWPTGGFTLIEMMVVIAIVAIFLTIGVPSFNDFISDQRVRTAASDLYGDLAYARAEAIKTSKRVIVERTSANWRDGWRIYVDLNDNASFDAATDTLLKVFDGFGTSRVQTCSGVADFASQIIFRPDGRVVRATAATANDGITISDNRGDTDPTNDKIRSLLFGLTGRISVLKQNGGTNEGVAC